MDNPDATRFLLCYYEDKFKTNEIYTNLWSRDKSNKYVWTIEHIFPEGENIPTDWIDMIANGDKDLAIEENLYQVPMSIFDEAYSHSAIAINDVNTEELVLKNATNDRIEASEKIKICDEEGICARDDEYPLVLEQEENTWKIAQIN